MARYVPIVIYMWYSSLCDISYKSYKEEDKIQNIYFIRKCE